MRRYDIVHQWYHDNIELIRAIFPDKFIKYDKGSYTWLYIEDFDLPSGWVPPYSNFLMRMAGLDGGIETAPYGFYVDKGLRTVSGRKPEHYFEGTTVNDLAELNYSYLSIHIRTWKPSLDVISGHNLATAIDLIYKRMARFTM